MQTGNTKSMALVVGSCVFLTCGANRAGESESSVALALSSKEPLVRQRIVQEVLGQRCRTIQEVTTLLKDAEIDRRYYGSLHRGIELLGKLRAAEAVSALCDTLTFVPEGFELDEMIPSNAYYVSAVALIEIGMPSIEAMRSIIRNDANKTRRELAAWVIMTIEGKDQALHRIDSIIGKTNFGRERFEAARKYIAEYEPTYGPPNLEAGQ